MNHEFESAESDLTYMTNPVNNERERLARIIRLRFQRVQKDIKEWLKDEQKSKDDVDYWEDNGGWRGWAERTYDLVNKWFDEPLGDALDICTAVSNGDKYDAKK